MPNFNAVAHLVRPAERAHTDIHTDRQTDILVKTEEHLSTKVKGCALRAHKGEERVHASRAQR